MRNFLHWFFEKISMVYLAVFVLFHIVMVHFLNDGKVNWQTITARLKECPEFFIWFYTISLALILYHALTRIWEMLIEYNLSPKYQKNTKRVLWILAGTLIILARLAIQPFLGG